MRRDILEAFAPSGQVAPGEIMLNAPKEPAGWVDIELHALVDVLSGAFAVRVLIGIALSIALYRAVGFLPRLLWRVGLDRQRRGAPVGSVLGLFVLMLGVLWTFRPAFEVAPAISLVAAGILMLVASLAVPNLLQSAMAGIRLSGRGRLIEGQQIEVDDVRGTVRRIGLLETTLRLSDGATVHLPNHLFAQSKLKVLRAQNAALVEVDARVEGELSDAQLQRLRAAVFLSPYRRAGTKPVIDESDRDRGRVEVHLQTWATRDADLVERALRRVVVATLEAPDDA